MVVKTMLRRLQKSKQMIAKGLAILGILVVGFGATYGIVKVNTQKVEPIIIQKMEDGKVEVREITIESVKDCLQELKVHECNMSETHTYTPDGWFTIGIKAKYYFDVKFSIDLTSMDNRQIIVEGDSVKIYCKGLKTDITCLENLCEVTEHGDKWYIFNDNKINVEKQNDVIKELKNVVKDKAIKEEGEQALISAEEGLETMLYKLTNRNVSVEIIVIG